MKSPGGIKMIQCVECKTMNAPEEEYCVQCSADLLPEPTIKEQRDKLSISIFAIVIAIGCLVLGILLATGRMDLPYIDRNDPRLFAKFSYWLQMIMFIPGGLILLIAGIYFLVKLFLPSDLDEKYLFRAKRHIGVDNDQAEADFGKAISLLPNSPLYFRERANFFEDLNRMEEALADYKAALRLLPSGDSRKPVQAAIDRINKSIRSIVSC